MSEENKEKLEKTEESVDNAQEDRDADFSKLDDPAYQLDELSSEHEKVKQDYLRALADLENFKKRAAKERSELLKYQGENILVDLLEVMDNLDYALAQKDTSLDELRTGLEMIHKLFADVLDKWGVKGTSSLGEKFDPNIQNALSALPDSSAPGTILQELKKAYHYKDKLIRAGEVVVSKEEEEKVEEEKSAEE